MREFGVKYEAAWFMCHRIRYAMQDKNSMLLSGTIEADETYIGPRRRRGAPVMHERIKDEQEMGLRPSPRAGIDWKTGKQVVFGIIERGGMARTMHVREASGKELQPILIKNIDLKASRLITDAHSAYRLIRRHLPHDVIKHELEYVRGDVHTQNIDSYWSTLKRGLFGTFHHVGEQHLGQYLSEFEYRFNRRKISDADRFYALLQQTEGRLAWYLKDDPSEA
jgi:hypothetical protein